MKRKNYSVMKADRKILQMKYARIVELFAKRMHISNDKALEMFYDSDTFMLVSEGVADMHCRSDEYLADELVLEYESGKKKDKK